MTRATAAWIISRGAVAGVVTTEATSISAARELPMTTYRAGAASIRHAIALGRFNTLKYIWYRESRKRLHNAIES